MTTSNRSALSRFLERLLRRSALTAEECDAILGLRSHAVQAPAHRDVISPGQEVRHSCLVVDGLLARFDQLKDGRRQITAFHIPGDMCDLHSVAAPTPDWGVEAMVTSTLLQVPHEALREAAQLYPAIALAFWRDTVADASVLGKWISNIGRKDARSRLAHLFCEMGLRMEQVGLGVRGCYRLELTQEQLADALGLTSVHVNRTLQTMAAEELATFRAKLVQVRDWDRLAGIAEFDPRFLLLEEPAGRAAA